MTLSDRDKKIVMVLVPLLLVGAFVFLVIKPKREEAAQAAQALAAQRSEREEAVAREQRLLEAKQTFAADYTTVVRLGKAVPTTVDMPSVLVQLEQAAKGTGIEFDKITPGERIPASGGATTAASGAGASSAGESSGAGSTSSAGGSAAGGSSAGTGAAAGAGGAPAQSGPGQATETANNAASGAGAASESRGGAAAATDTQTATSSKQGGVPVGGGATGSSPAGSGPAPVEGLDTVPLEMSFTGSFFDLADFFHRLKRFVRVSNNELALRGRLMTIDSFSFSSDQSFPKIEATLNGRIFLAPRESGSTGGASPAGPGSPSAAGGSAPAAAGSSPTTPSPTATAPPVGP